MTDEVSPPETRLDAEAERPGAWPFVVGLIAPILVGILFLSGYGELNRSEPNTGAARAFYLVTMAGGAGTVLALLLMSDQRRLDVASWGLGGGLVWGVIAAFVAQDGYGFLAEFGLMMLFSVVWAAFGITVGIAAGTGGSMTGSVVARSGGAALGGGIGMAALYHASTLSEQARRAEEANTPGVGFVLLLFFLVAVAWKMRP